MICGGMIDNAVMNGRLADNRMELARVRADLDRKSEECSRLQKTKVKDLRSSQPNGKNGKNGKNKGRDRR